MNSVVTSDRYAHHELYTSHITLYNFTLSAYYHVFFITLGCPEELKIESYVQ